CRRESGPAACGCLVCPARHGGRRARGPLKPEVLPRLWRLVSFSQPVFWVRISDDRLRLRRLALCGESRGLPTHHRPSDPYFCRYFPALRHGCRLLPRSFRLHRKRHLLRRRAERPASPACGLWSSPPLAAPNHGLSMVFGPSGTTCHPVPRLVPVVPPTRFEARQRWLTAC